MVEGVTGHGLGGEMNAVNTFTIFRQLGKDNHLYINLSYVSKLLLILEVILN